MAQRDAKRSPKPVRGKRPATGKSRTRDSDGREREARDAGVRFARGEAVGPLGAAPAAKAPLGGAGGVALPSELRVRLEAAFDADLSAIRVHADGAAGALAARERATAFAASNHLYFGRGMWRPGTPAGERLIGHEVAHAVQQAGRRSTDGRLAVVRAAGSGCIQREWDPIDSEKEQLELLYAAHWGADRAGDARVAIVELVQTHLQEAIPSVERVPEAAVDVTALIDEVARRGPRALLGGQSSDWGPIFDIIKYYWITGSEELRASAFRALIRILDQGFGVRTVAFRSDLANEIHADRDQDDDARFLLNPALDADDLQDEWPSRVLESLRDWLLDPSQSAPEPVTWYREEAERRWAAGFPAPEPGLHRSERVAIGWFSVAAQVESMIEVWGRMDDEVRRQYPRWSAARRRGWIAFRLSGLDPAVEGVRYYESLAESIRGVAAPIADFWNVVIGSMRTTEAGLARRRTVEALGIGHESGAFPAEIRDLLGAVLRDLLLPTLELGPDGALRYPFEYKTMLEAVLMSLDVAQTRLAAFAPDVLGEDVAQDEDALQVARALGWLEAAYRHLSSYSSADAGPLYDLQRIHRVRTAEMVAAWGRVLGLQEIVDVARGVMVGSDLGSYVALGSEWFQDAARPHQMLEDFPGNVIDDAPIIEEWPVLRVEHLVVFDRLTYLVDVHTQLQRVLEVARRQGDAMAWQSDVHDSLTQQALGRLTSRRSERWAVNEFEFVIDPEDPATAKSLLENHPRTALDLPVQPPGGAWIFPTTGYGRVFAWWVPPLGALVAELKRSRELNALVREVTGHLRPRRLPPDEWIAALADEAVVQRAVEAISVHLTARRDTVEEDVDSALIEATRLERASLRRFIDSNLEDGYTDLPGFAAGMGALSSLYDRVMPARDADLHQAVLTLEVADTLRSALGDPGMTMFVYIVQGLMELEDTWEALDEADPERLEAVIGPGSPVATTTERDRRVGVLEDLEEILDEKLQRASQLVGLHGHRPQGETAGGLTMDGWPRPLAIGHSWVADGTYYRLVNVRQDFVYYPPVGVQTREGEDLPAGSVRAQVLPVDDREEFDRHEVLLEIAVGAPPPRTARSEDAEEPDLGSLHILEITAGDIDELTRVFHATSSGLFTQSMDNLLQVMSLDTLFEGFMLALDLASLLPPPFGPAFAAASLVIGVGEFLISGEWDAIREVLGGASLERLAEVSAELAEFVGEEGQIRVFEFLLTPRGVNPLSRLMEREGTDSERRVRRTRGRFGRIVRAITRVGGKVGDGLATAQRGVSRPVQGLASTLAGRPMLREILSLAPILIAMGAQAARRIEELEQMSETPISFADVNEGLQATLQGFSELELPVEILPQEILIEALIDYILRRVGRGKGRLAATILEATGLMSEVADMVNSALEFADFDPVNQLWESDVRGPLNERFTTIRDELAGGLETMLEPISDFARGELPASAVTDEELDLDEEEGQFYGGIGPGSLRLPRSPGRRLPGRSQVAAERLLGHDLSHVRLHGGSEGDAVTRRLGVEGVASGSHVYLPSSLGLESARGRDVLNHELAHVVQQTGDRPLGGHHDTTPRRGRPGSLTYDHHLETEAHEAARGRGVRGRRQHGAQPALADRMATLLIGHVTDFDTSRDLFEQVRSEARIGGVNNVSNGRLARWIWDGFVDFVDGNWSRVHADWLDRRRPGSTDTGISLVRSHLRSNHSFTSRALGSRTWLTQVNAIAQRALPARDDPRPGQRRPQVSPARFVELIEAYLLAKTGIGFSIDIDRVRAETARRRPATSLVSSVSVNNVFLGAIGSGSAIWDAVRRTNFSLGDTEWREKRRQLRAYVLARGPVAGMWNKGVGAGLLEIDGGFLGELQETLDALERQERAGAPVLGERFPTWRQYVDADGTDSHGFHLKVDTHGGLTGGFLPDRNSHHIIQWLLIEYFSNLGTGDRPFSQVNTADDGFPGITAVRGIVDRIGSIDVSTPRGNPTGSGRGRGMPAISLAGVTHRRGRLHVNAITWGTEEEDEYGEASGQRDRVHAWFRTGVRDADALEWVDLRPGDDTPDRTPESDARITSAFEDGARHAYSQMKAHMVPALRTALQEHEVPYYRALAAAAGKVESGADARESEQPLQEAYDLTESRVLGAWRAARDDVESNYETTWGWR